MIDPKSTQLPKLFYTRRGLATRRCQNTLFGAGFDFCYPANLAVGLGYVPALLNTGGCISLLGPSGETLGLVLHAFLPSFFTSIVRTHHAFLSNLQPGRDLREPGSCH